MRGEPEGSGPPFRRGDVAFRLDPYPTGVRPALASSPVLYPPAHRLLSRISFPGRRGARTSFPRFRRCAGMGTVDPLFAVVRRLRRGSQEPPGLTTCQLRPSVTASSLVLSNTFVAASHDFDPSTRSWSPTASMLAVATSVPRSGRPILRGLGYVVPRGLRTPPLPGALPGGIPLTEQRVLSASPGPPDSHVDDFVWQTLTA